MSINNLLADGIARIKNAQARGLSECDILASKFVVSVLKVLQSGGFIDSYEKKKDNNYLITVKLKYDDQRRPIIAAMRLCSTGSNKKYIGKKSSIRRVYSNRSMFVVSTSHGVMDLAEMRAHGIGGELILEVQ
jgi:ribosomal protein S8